MTNEIYFTASQMFTKFTSYTWTVETKVHTALNVLWPVVSGSSVEQKVGGQGLLLSPTR